MQYIFTASLKNGRKSCTVTVTAGSRTEAEKKAIVVGAASLRCGTKEVTISLQKSK